MRYRAVIALESVGPILKVVYMVDGSVVREKISLFGVEPSANETVYSVCAGSPANAISLAH